MDILIVIIRYALVEYQSIAKHFFLHTKDVCTVAFSSILSPQHECKTNRSFKDFPLKLAFQHITVGFLYRIRQVKRPISILIQIEVYALLLLRLSREYDSQGEVYHHA